MHRALYLLTIVTLTTQLALAEVTQIKLLNPDGTPALDAQAIAIMTTGTRVDANLKELPSLRKQMPDSGGTAVATNESGTIKFDSKALAILAQSKAGFAFIPLPNKIPVTKLRPWAKLQIDLSTMPPENRKTQHVSVIWENCFAGDPPRPSNLGDDPFGGDPFAQLEWQLDWRFDSYVMWSLSVEAATDQVVNVPPGEVTVVFSNEDFSVLDLKSPIPFVRYSALRTPSDKQISFKTPELGSITGKLVEDSHLPDWNNGIDNALFVSASNTNTGLEVLLTGLDMRTGSPTLLDELARRYASEAGTKLRHSRVPEVLSRVNEDGTFQLNNLPAGKYALALFHPSRNPIPLKRRGDSKETPITFEINGTNALPTDIGEVERATPPLNPKAIQTQIVPSDDPFTDTAEGATNTDPFAGSDSPATPSPRQKPPLATDAIARAEQAINTRLASTTGEIEHQGTALRTVMDELRERHRVPIRFNRLTLDQAGVDVDAPINISLPAITLQSALRHILASVSEELTFTIRDEMLLITTKEDAAKDVKSSVPLQSTTANPGLAPPPTQFDTGAQFVEKWLKSSKNGEEPNELRSALKKHLEQEFNANQQSRQSELVRLRDLLKQSEDWIKTRQAKRDEIVGKRIVELLKP